MVLGMFSSLLLLMSEYTCVTMAQLTGMYNIDLMIGLENDETA